jgi:hypothetical protein
MKSLFLLALGGLCGVLATVLFFTIDPTFTGSDTNGTGGGNVTIQLTEEALAALVVQQLATLPNFGQKPQVQVSVGSNGLMTIDIAVGAVGLGVRHSLTLNPNIEAGRLKLDVVEADLGDLAVPEELARLIEVPIQSRLDSLAEGLDYNLVGIRTTDRLLTLEIEI